MAVLPSTKYRNNERTVSGNVIVENSDALINVDTSLVACTINLKDIPADYWSTFYILYIKDLSGNCATNNITIVAPAGFKINNQQSIILNVNSVCVTIKIASNTDYNTSYNTQTITGGHIVADEGTPLAQQPILNFVGELVAATDGAGETIVTINNNLRVQNTIYVTKNGSDTTGLVERLDKPFLTITAATNAAVTYFTGRTSTLRVKIIVESGYYIENINLQKFIDYDLGNSVINGCITDNGVDFGAITSGWHCIIYGQATINKTTSSSSYNQAFILLGTNNNVLVNCDKIASSLNDAVAMLGGYAKIYCNDITSTSTFQYSHNAINMAVLTSVPANRCLLEVIGASIVTGGNNFSPAIDFAGDSAQTLKLINCYVKTTIVLPEGGGTNSAITSGATSLSTSGILYLYNTTIYSLLGNSIEVLNSNGTCNLTVYGIHSNVANVATVANTPSTLTTLINTITINASLPY